MVSQSVEYADAHTRSEERLRNSEADCAALWEEREEAKERLCAAFIEGRALEEKLDGTMTDTLQLRQALEETEARLATAVKEAEEAGNELGASCSEVSGIESELEAMNERCVLSFALWVVGLGSSVHDLSDVAGQLVVRVAERHCGCMWICVQFIFLRVPSKL